MTGPPVIEPAEQQAYEELLGYTLSHGGAEFVHQYAVDAWAAQHADAETRPMKLTFALAGLYLHLDKGLSGRQVQRLHMRLARQRPEWPALALPQERGAITARDVIATSPGRERDQALDAWCTSVWGAYGGVHRQVVEWLRRCGID